MNKRNYYNFINKLALISSILVLLGDFIDFLVSYQEYRDGFLIEENKDVSRLK
ncbi:MAG: hypothetical protein ACOYIF_04640 [Acetivibrionales bacterium]|jgi:hypothetical protein